MSEWNDHARITVDSVSWGQLWWEVLEAWAASVIGMVGAVTELCWGQRAWRPPGADECVERCVAGRRFVVRSVEDRRMTRG